MQPSDFIIALLNSLPSHEIKGKKRLQKLAFLVKEAALECGMEFRLMDYGPYSPRLANTADSLSFFGHLKQEEKAVGTSGTFVTVYSTPTDEQSPTLDERYRKIVQCLDQYTTIELEVAATIKYFESCGMSPSQAETETKAMKPSKAVDGVVRKARKVLQCLVTTGPELDARAENSRSHPQPY